MRYELYVDCLFLECFLWNFVILTLTNEALYRVCGPFRRIFMAAASAAVNVLVFVLPLPALGRGIVLRAGFFLMTGLTFRARSPHAYGNVLLCLWKNVILYGGILWALVKGISWMFPRGMRLVGIILLGTLVFIGWAIFNRRRRLDGGGQWKAVLTSEKGSIVVEAMVDSGNSLYEPISGKAVCVLDPGVAAKLWGEGALYRVIPYHCVKASGIMKGFLADELRISTEGPEIVRRNVYVAVSPNPIMRDGEGAALLIHPALLYK